jgi:hypothetical protein
MGCLLLAVTEHDHVIGVPGCDSGAYLVRYSWAAWPATCRSRAGHPPMTPIPRSQSRSMINTLSWTLGHLDACVLRERAQFGQAAESDAG